MRRSVAPIYALIFLETLVWIAMVPLAPTFADQLGLSGVETGFILAAASLAALVVAFPLGLLADRVLGAYVDVRRPDHQGLGVARRPTTGGATSGGPRGG